MSQDTEDETEAIASVDIELNEAELRAGLVASCKLGRFPLVKRLLDLNADFSYLDSRGWGPLHWSCYYGHHEIVEALLSAGAGMPYREEAFLYTSLNSPFGINSPTSPMSPSPPAAAQAIRTPNVVNSPLHIAISRGHVRCVWALLSFGMSTTDVDNSGNTALHVAASTTPPSSALRKELLMSCMYAGFDPHTRNWMGFTALDLVPSDDSASRELLLRAGNATECASTGDPFSVENLRYLCACTGGFYSEAASSPANVHAFAPAIPGVTLPTPDAPGSSSPLPDPVTDGSPQCFVTCDGYPIAILEGDEFLLRPIRLATEAFSKIADAESALETALNPFSHLVANAVESLKKVAVLSEGGQGNVKPSDPPLSPEDERVGGESSKTASSPTSSSLGEEDSTATPSILVPTGASGFDSPIRRKSPNSSSDAVQGGGLVLSPNFSFPLELFADASHIAAIEGALHQCKIAHCDTLLITKAFVVLARLSAASRALASANALVASRPIPSRTHPSFQALDLSTAEAAKYGVGRSFLGHLLLSKAMALCETELLSAKVVAGRISLATHAHDAVIQRLSTSLDKMLALEALMQRASTGEEMDAPTPVEISSICGVPWDGGFIFPEPICCAKVMGGQQPPIPLRFQSTPIPSNLPPCPSAPPASIQGALALKQRLLAEVALSDFVGRGEAAIVAHSSCVVAHLGNDPTLLSTPPLPPVPPEATLPPAPAAAAKGGKSGSAAQAPPKSGKGAPPASEEPPPHPPVDAALPCDAAGVPLPHTPQIIALFELRDSLSAIENGIAEGSVAGADTEALDAARKVLENGKSTLADGLLQECLRCEEWRAKKKKGAKKGKPKAK